MTTRTQSSETRAVQVLEPQEVEFNLDRFPEDRFNRLIHTQTIRMPSDLMVPVVQVVQLDVARDTYESPDIPKGNRAPNKVALRKLATAAGISIIDERRTDDGSDPDVCEVTCVAEMVLPTGQRIRAPGVKRVDLGRMPWASDKQRAKYASFFQEHVASRAENRAIRALLSLQASYPVAELRRPFAVVTYAPNMSHPEVRARILDAMAPTVQALYGPEQARQLTAGDGVTEVSPAPDDEDDGRYVELRTNGTATVDRTTGEVVAETPAHEDEEEPDWFGEPPPVADDEPSLVEELRQRAEASSMAGSANAQQRPQLSRLLSPLGVDPVAVVLKATFGLDDRRAITAAQAQAILGLAAADVDAFRERWSEEAEQLLGSEAA